MKLVYYVLVWIIGMLAALGVGIVLKALGFFHPETYVLWIMVIWTVWRVIKLLLWISRYV